MIQHLSHDEFEILPNKLGGTTKKWLLKFKKNIRGVFKLDTDHDGNFLPWANGKAEVAAFELDQLLDLEVVPTTVLRTIGKDSGALQVFLNGKESPSHSVILSRNFSRIQILDYLIGNTDRKLENFLFWREFNRGIAIDNGSGFNSNCLDGELLKGYIKMDLALAHKIDSVSDEQIHQALAPYIEESAIHRTIERLHLLKSIHSNENLPHHSTTHAY